MPDKIAPPPQVPCITVTTNVLDWESDNPVREREQAMRLSRMLFVTLREDPALSLSDVYNTIGYYLRHQNAVEAYLNQREHLAESVEQRLSSVQPDLSLIRSRLLSQQQH